MSDKFKTDYDFEGDLLYLYNEAKKSKGSVEFGEDIVIDFDKGLNIVALEFFNASKVLGSLTGEKITKKMLSGIKKADLISERKGGLMMAFFSIKINGQKTIEERLNLQDINYKSPVLAYAK